MSDTTQAPQATAQAPQAPAEDLAEISVDLLALVGGGTGSIII